MSSERENSRPGISLGEMLEEMTDRLQASNRMDVHQLISNLDEEHVELRELLPVLGLLGELGNSDSVAEVDPPNPEEAIQVEARSDLKDFRILRELGRGGMGVVYEAEQLSLGRHVALKVLSGVPHLDGCRADRFENEIRVAAVLEHPHIVPVYGAGKTEGSHFYVMRLIRGDSLDRVLARLIDVDGTRDEPLGWRDSTRHARSDESHAHLQDASSSGHSATSLLHASPVMRRLAPNSLQRYDEIARLGVQAAEALHHAHQLGVVHRDIKPSNLLVSGDGHLWLADFGLARYADRSALTASGDVIGTIRYMAPEQACGSGTVVDHRADVYGLGVTLYELLTLRAAFSGDRAEMLAARSDARPPSPARRINSAVPRDLETIVAKAMAYETADRYATAGDLAEDLQRFLENQPILAKPPTVAERLFRVARRHAVASCLAFLATLLIAIVMTFSVYVIAQERNAARLSANRERRAADVARQQMRVADEARQQAGVNLQYARAAVDRMFARANNELPRDAHYERIRHDLLEDARDFYQLFVQQDPQNDTLKYDLAVTFDRVGEIHYHLGHADQAEAASERAFELFSELATKYPDVPQYLLDLAENATDRAKIRLAKTASQDQAIEINRLRIHWLLRLVRQFPDGVNYSAQVATAYTDSAKLLMEMGHVDEAQDALNVALCFWRAVDDVLNETIEFRVGLARTYHYVGNAMSQEQRLAAANNQYQIARAVLRDDWSPTAQRLLGEIEQAEARILAREGEIGRAVSKLTDAIRRNASVAASFPDPVNDQDRLASCHWDLFRLMTSSGRQDAARQALEESTYQLRLIAGAKEGLLSHRLALARNYFVQGELLHASRAFPEAASCFRESLAILKACMQAFPNSSEPFRSLSEFLEYCPDEQFRDARRAAVVGQRAELLQLHQQQYRRALGLVHSAMIPQRDLVFACERAGQLDGVAHEASWGDLNTAVYP